MLAVFVLISPVVAWNFTDSLVFIQGDELMSEPCVVPRGWVSGRCCACSFMRTDKHASDGMSGGCGRSPESSPWKQCRRWGERDCVWRWETPVGGGQEVKNEASWKGHYILSITVRLWLFFLNINSRAPSDAGPQSRRVFRHVYVFWVQYYFFKRYFFVLILSVPFWHVNDGIAFALHALWVSAVTLED